MNKHLILYLFLLLWATYSFSQEIVFKKYLTQPAKTKLCFYASTLRMLSKEKKYFNEVKNIEKMLVYCLDTSKNSKDLINELIDEVKTNKFENINENNETTYSFLLANDIRNEFLGLIKKNDIQVVFFLRSKMDLKHLPFEMLINKMVEFDLIRLDN